MARHDVHYHISNAQFVGLWLAVGVIGNGGAFNAPDIYSGPGAAEVVDIESVRAMLGLVLGD